MFDEKKEGKLIGGGRKKVLWERERDKRGKRERMREMIS